MRLRRLAAVALSMTMGLGLMACGNTAASNTDNGTTNSTATAAEVETKTNTLSKSDEPSSPNYEKSLSGKVVVYMPSPSGLNTKYVEGFEKKTGLEVELFEGTTGEILARLEAEKDNPVADVVVLASWSDGLSYEAQGKTLSYVPYNASKMYGDWVDDNRMIYGTSASAVGVIYNTTIFQHLRIWQRTDYTMPEPIRQHFHL